MMEHQLVINTKKCVFAKTQLEYLGHIISADGVQAEPSKIKAMVDWPKPKDLKALRGFLGLTGYYQRFVKNYGKIAAPLTALLRKDSFKWGVEAQEAFERLKKTMTTLPVLDIPDFSLPFELETDASGVGVGAVLMQRKRPIAYYSQALAERHRLKSVYERELMVVVLAVKRWRHYLLGHHFVIKTDQRALKYLLEQRELNNEQQKWVSKLLGYSFEIHYNPGKDNKVADSLSRKEEVELKAFSVQHLEELNNWEEEVKKDEKLSLILQQLVTNQDPPEGYTLLYVMVA